MIFSVACLSCNFGLMTVLLSAGAFDDHSFFFVSGEHTKISELVSWGAGNYWRNLAQVHFSEHRCAVRIRFPDAAAIRVRGKLDDSGCL